MANYDKELIDLLKQYLTDGVITPKEREVLLRKAESLNINRDEFDLYIDAELQKLDDEIAAAKRKEKGKLCPYCETQIPMMASTCPGCGKAITPEASKEVEEILNALEDALVDFKSGSNIEKSKANVERYARKAKMYYGENQKIQRILEEVMIEQAKTEKKHRNQKILTFIMNNKKWVIIISIILIGLIGSTISSILEEPVIDYANDPEVCIEVVNEALDKGDVSKAEGYCTSYVSNTYGDYDDIKAIFPAFDAIVKYHTNKVNDFIYEEDWRSAIDYIETVNVHPGVRKCGTSYVVSMYDPLYLKLIRALWEAGEYNRAEEVALAWSTKIDNDMSWDDAGSYKYLKAKYKETRKDFSLLKGEYDYE